MNFPNLIILTKARVQAQDSARTVGAPVKIHPDFTRVPKVWILGSGSGSHKLVTLGAHGLGILGSGS